MNTWCSYQSIKNAFDSWMTNKVVEFGSGGLFEKRRGDFASG